MLFTKTEKNKDYWICDPFNLNQLIQFVMAAIALAILYDMCPDNLKKQTYEWWQVSLETCNSAPNSR